MDSFLVKGLSGKRNLEGVLPVFGAKNSALKAQASSLLFEEEVLIANLPLIEDVLRMNDALCNLGVRVEQAGAKTFRFKLPETIKTNIDRDIARSLRSSIVLTGPILAREGKVSFPYPGGCVIGKRPIDVFLSSFEKLGAKARNEGENYFLEAKRLRGAEIFFKLPSVTATETIMMTAVLIKGKTVLSNCACEPEIVCLADFLNAAGAEIRGAGTHTIVINGKGKLLKNGIFNTPPDRIEAGSFAVISALLGKNLRISGCDSSHLGAVFHALEKVGVSVKREKDHVLVKGKTNLKATDIKTNEYPGFPTDLQAPFSVLLTQARGKSLIFETVFEGRLNYALDLERMGADIIICDPHRAIINGPTTLRGREMESPDLRAGLAFLIASMVAEGDSIVHNAYNIDRGYEKIEERLNAVGAGIRRIKK